MVEAPAVVELVDAAGVVPVLATVVPVVDVLVVEAVVLKKKKNMKTSPCIY